MQNIMNESLLFKKYAIQTSKKIRLLKVYFFLSFSLLKTLFTLKNIIVRTEYIMNINFIHSHLAVSHIYF